MSFDSHPSTGLRRYVAAVSLATIALAANAYMQLKAPVTGLPPAGATVLRVVTGSGSERGRIDDKGQASFSGALKVRSNMSGSSLNVDGTSRLGSGIIINRTTDIGWSVQAAANQACNTTCVSACVMGEDTSVLGSFVACSDATADRCVCAGSN